MFFSTTILATIGLLGLAQASPVPEAPQDVVEIVPVVFLTEAGEVESFVNATALGVDIYGPIPDDAIVVDDHYMAEAGSKAYAWVRAQADIDWESAPVEKRQAAQLEMTFWSGDNCGGQLVIFWGGINYDVSYFSGDNFFSMAIGWRAIRGNEHLDISRSSNGDACGAFVARLIGGPGCATTNLYNCARLWVE